MFWSAARGPQRLAQLTIANPGEALENLDTYRGHLIIAFVGDDVGDEVPSHDGLLHVLGQDFRRLIWAVEKTEEEKGTPQPEDIPQQNGNSQGASTKSNQPHVSQVTCVRCRADWATGLTMLAALPLHLWTNGLETQSFSQAYVKSLDGLFSNNGLVLQPLHVISLGKETYQLPIMITREFSPFRAKIFFRACSRLLPLSGCSFFTQSLSSWRLGERITT